MDEKKYVIVRTYSAGVHAGYLKWESDDGNIVRLEKSRRIWYWAGAATLSQLAMEGVSKPDECKFPCEVNEIKLIGVIEIIVATKKAKKSIADVEIWAK